MNNVVNGTATMPLELTDYVRDLFAPHPPELQRLTRAAHEFGMPVDWEISPDVGLLFQLLCRAIGARRVVEFGTLAGHSAYWFATALPADGKVISLELNPDYAQFAREQLAIMGLADKVEVRTGACRDQLPALKSEALGAGGLFDIIFLDADKAHYPEFLAWARDVLRPGGILLADNVLRSGSWNGQGLLDPDADDPRILAIREFNRELAESPQFTSLIVPIRSGVAVALYQP